jgi:hypothetical protein
MAEPQVDSVFMQYWSRLTIVEKESLLIVARNYVQLKGRVNASSGDTRDICLCSRSGKSIYKEKVGVIAGKR